MPSRASRMRERVRAEVIVGRGDFNGAVEGGNGNREGKAGGLG